ncbi:MAG TPA: drug:proton antiporter, partial [Acidimicrobiaceae bacterium]|nr:drug:proton antiporter [Acidimicrobiaceae bacterium]
MDPLPPRPVHRRRPRAQRPSPSPGLRPRHDEPMSDDDHLVVFTPSGRRGDVSPGTTVLDAARRLGVDIDSVCGGRGICGRCQVEPMFGEFAKHGITADASHLSPPGTVEADYRGRRPLTEDRRLSCTATIRGDLVVDVPAESQVHRQVIRKDIDQGDIELDPVLVLRLVEFGEGDDLLAALGNQWGLTGLELPPDLDIVADGSSLATVAIRDDSQVVAVWPGLRDRALGVAVDVGSTTLAGHLFDLATGTALATAGTMNPQIRFGEDLMSRVSYVMMNPGGEVELTRAVRESLDELIDQLCEEGGTTRDEILELVLVGNPIMHHLLLGLDPTPLGVAPFTLEISEAVDRTATELDLEVHPAARAHMLPCIAGHVGADTAAVVLATRPHEADRVQLVVDIGTNAEIVLSGHGRTLAASSPTG